jgi:hypothetical protein
MDGAEHQRPRVEVGGLGGRRDSGQTSPVCLIKKDLCKGQHRSGEVRAIRLETDAKATTRGAPPPNFGYAPTKM